MQDQTLQGETVRTESGGHMTTGILGNYRPDFDAFDGWIFTPGTVAFTVTGGVSSPGFGTNHPGGAITKWIDAGFREWDPTEQDKTQNGQLFIRRPGGLGPAASESDFLAYMTKREAGQLPDQFGGPAPVSSSADTTGQNSPAGAPAPVDQAPPAQAAGASGGAAAGGLKKKKNKNKNLG